MKIKKEKWYNFTNDKVCEVMEGDLTFVNEFSLEMDARDHLTGEKHKEYIPASVYHNTNPNREKGHKDYMILFKYGDRVMVTGRDLKDLEKDRHQRGILCNNCDTVLYSIARHHFHKCDCDNETFIDGGKDYMRCGGKDMSNITYATIDLLTDEVKLDTK